MLAAQRATQNRKITGVNRHQTSAHLARPDHGPVTGGVTLAAVDSLPGRVDTGSEFAEAARVHETVDALPGRQLAAPMLSFDVLDAPAEAIFLFYFP